MLVHECAHIIRRDVAVGLVQRLLAILCWFHPLIHVLNRRLSRAREEVCDNYVLRNGEPGRYARTLLTVAEHVTAARAIPAGVGLLQPHWKLENRIAGLLNRRRKIMVRANRILLAPLFLALAMAGIIIAGIRPVAAAGNEPDRTPAANAAAGADRPDARPAGKKAPREFSFDKLIVKVDSFAAHENLTTTFQKDGSFVVEPHPLSQPHRDRVNPSRYRLSSTVMAQLEYLLKEADYLKEPPIEKIATDDDRGVVELIQRTRAKNPDDPAIRYYEATIRMRRAGLAMGTDGTWFTFTLLRKGEKRVLSRYQEELKRPPVNLLVRFMRRLYAQETFYHQLTSLDPDRNDPLLDLNLRLDHALGRRNLNDPWLMLPLDFGRLADPLQELADSDDPRSAARAQRAIRAIRRLPDGDYGRPLIPVPPAEADRLATFYLFRLNRLGERDEQEHLAIAPDGWFEFWISGPPKDTEYRERVYRHVGKLPREKLERLDELLVATKHFRRTDATYGFSAPRKRGVYEMAVIHEARLRRVLSHTKRRSKEYEDLQDFVTDQIVGLMKRRESK